MSFSIKGLNHLALVVEDINAAKKWFIDCLGLSVLEDRGELVILKAGNDVIAVKTKSYAINKPEFENDNFDFPLRSGWQTLDHYGFYAASPEEVDTFAEKLKSWDIPILKGPYSRSDGRSVYFRDPCGNVGEYFFYTGH